MPLAFRSLSHGTVAFGFFNIESDMLLLEQAFFFADRFCRAVVELAQALAEARGTEGSVEGSAAIDVALDGWRIDEPAEVGNLHGAIAGVDLSGFIGATYERFPFPAHPEAFKQSPKGARSQTEVTAMIERFGRPERFELSSDSSGERVRLAGIDFDGQAFAELVDYVEHGGYPRYQGERRPSYVEHMMTELVALSAPWVAAIIQQGS